MTSISWKGPATKLCSNPDDNPLCFSLPVEQLRGKPLSPSIVLEYFTYRLIIWGFAHSPGVSQWRITLKLLTQVANELSSADTSEVESQVVKWEGSPHENVACDNCDQSSIQGRRFLCIICPNYNLCESCCVEDGSHEHVVFLAIPSGKMSNKLEGFLHGPACKEYLRKYWLMPWSQIK